MDEAPQSLQIYLRIYVTQNPNSGVDARLGEGSSDAKDYPDSDVITEKLPENDRIRVETGRPDVHALLEEELTDATGTVSVDGVFQVLYPANLTKSTDGMFPVAGPADLAGDVRKALRFGVAGPKAVLKGGPDVTLHVETYGIAVSAAAHS
jgi:ferric-chelate reductase